MNKTNMQHAIAVMKRAAAANAINMEMFQTLSASNANQFQTYASNEQQLHKCGNKACFAGYLALSEEFRTLQPEGYYGTVSGSGFPQIIHIDSGKMFSQSDAAIGQWLGIDAQLIEFLIFDKFDKSSVSLRGSSPQYLYQKDWKEVTGEDIVTVLESILEKGVVPYFREVLSRIPEHDIYGRLELESGIEEELAKDEQPA